jgi:alpha-beta hydrolase superfamily lysophospholipase
MLTPAQRLRFVLLMSSGAAALSFRDAIVKVVAPNSAIARSRRAAADFQSPFLTQIFIASSQQGIEAQLALPNQPPTAMVLLCHGIGERFYFWREVQHLLAASGIGSLVFHYPGYGRSTGFFTPENVDASAHAAYAYLRGLAPGAPLFVFGTSLGTAVAAHVAGTLSPVPVGLILAQGFTTLREAAKSVLRTAHLPTVLSKLLPDVWRNTQAFTKARCPILIVHGESDYLFPVAMGQELFRSAQLRPDGRQSLLTPAGFDHSDPMLGSAVEAYWQPILDFIRAESLQQER